MIAHYVGYTQRPTARACWRSIGLWIGPLGAARLRDVGGRGAGQPARSSVESVCGSPRGGPAPRSAGCWAQPFWGHGYATEAARASLGLGFTHRDFVELISLIYPSNAASIRGGQQHRRDATAADRAPARHRRSRDAYVITRPEWEAGCEARDVAGQPASASRRQVDRVALGVDRNERHVVGAGSERPRPAGRGRRPRRPTPPWRRRGGRSPAAPSPRPRSPARPTRPGSSASAGTAGGSGGPRNGRPTDRSRARPAGSPPAPARAAVPPSRPPRRARPESTPAARWSPGTETRHRRRWRPGPASARGGRPG